MSSSIIYKNKPFFYIIQHILSGKKYAGCRYGKSSDPNLFWKPGGYFTSSSLVHRIIDLEGVNSFKILEIKTDFSDFIYTSASIPVSKLYEEWFFNRHNCRKSDDWLNLPIGKSIGKSILKYDLDNRIKLDLSLPVLDCGDIDIIIKDNFGKEVVSLKGSLRETFNLMNYPIEDFSISALLDLPIGSGEYSGFQVFLSPKSRIIIDKVHGEYYNKISKSSKIIKQIKKEKLTEVNLFKNDFSELETECIRVVKDNKFFGHFHIPKKLIKSYIFRSELDKYPLKIQKISGNLRNIDRKIDHFGMKTYAVE